MPGEIWVAHQSFEPPERVEILEVLPSLYGEFISYRALPLVNFPTPPIATHLEIFLMIYTLEESPCETPQIENSSSKISWQWPPRWFIALRALWPKSHPQNKRG